MDAEQFEEMCCALFDKQPGIAQADRHHAPRQRQFGVDILAQRIGEGDIEVASCKCYGALKKGQIGEFSDEFLPHWKTYWQDKSVQKFVLCVAADVRSQQRQTEIAGEVTRFEAIGIEYSVWGPRQLQELLRPHPGIVSQYLGDEWVPRLCGTVRPDTAPPSTGQAVLDNVVATQLAALQTALSEEVEARLEIVRNSLRRGHRNAVADELASIRSDHVRWNSLAPDIQARILRLQAVLNLGDGKIDEAEALADDADAAFPADEPRLRALIAFRKKGPDLALQVLAEPTTQDGINLRAAFLLEVGDHVGASELLKSTTSSEDPETWRLRAFAFLMSGDRESALHAQREAERIAPNWLAVKHAAGMIRYALALSPAVKYEPSSWPNPIALDLVRQDDLSLSYLRDAEQFFDDLIAGDLDAGETKNLEIWKIACLANQRNRASEAQTYCAHLINENRSNAGAIAWALARGYEFDRAKVRKSLEDLLEAGGGVLEHVFTLASLHLESGRADKASAALARFEGRFPTPTERALLAHWNARIAVEMGEAVPGRVTESVEPWSLILALEKSCRADANWDPLIEFMERHQDDPALVYAGARTLGNEGKWEAVAPYVGLLLEKVATADAIGLGAIAAFNSGDAPACLAILDEHVTAFPSARLPHQLRRLQVAAYRRIGDLASAGRYAASLAIETRATHDVLTLIDAKIEAGDVRGVLPHIREAIKEEGLTAEDAVRLSAIVRHEDPDLARRLLREAQTKEIPRAFATLAFELAIGLGLGSEATPLYTALDAAASDESDQSVHRISIDEIPELVRRRQEQAEQLTRTYLEGKAPVHLLAAAGNINLGALFWRAFSRAEADWVPGDLPLLIQHGSRRIPDNFAVPIENWRLHMDVTAVFTASNLGLLDVVEERFAPLVLPHALPQTLLLLEQNAHPHQPRRLEALRKILSAIEAGHIQEFSVNAVANPVEVRSEGPQQKKSRLLQYAQDLDGFVVDFNEPAVSVPESLATRIVNLRSVTDTLYETGALDESEYNAGLAEMGVYGQEAPLGRSKPGQVLIFCANTIEVLAEAGLLNPAMDRYDLYTENWYVESAKNEVAIADEGNRVAEWIQGLRTRIAEGIENGTYILLPHNPQLIDEIADGMGAIDGPERCLVELLSIPSGQQAMVWIDDRCVTGYSNTNGHPIVGVAEILAALETSGIIDEKIQFGALRRMHEARTMFLPLHHEEVRYHVNQAPIEAGQVIETPALCSLRRCFSALLLLEDNLDLVDQNERTDGKKLELWCLLSAYRLAGDSIAQIWQQSDLALEVKQTQSAWVWEALRVERFRRLPIHHATEEGRSHLFSMSLAGLFLNAMQMPSEEDGDQLSTQASYLNWVYDNVAGSVFRGDPDLLQTVARILREVFESLLEEKSSEPSLEEDLGVSEDIAKKFLVQKLIDSFPRAVREAILNDSNFRSSLGIEFQSVVQIQELSFEAEAFWEGAELALSNGTASVPTHDESKILEMHSLRDGEQTQALTLKGALTGKFENPILEILSSDFETRIRCLRAHPDWLDYPGETFEGRIETIANLEPASKRMAALDAERNISVPVNYARLMEALESKSEMSWSLFHPVSAGALVRFLRLESSAPNGFAVLVHDAAQDLVDQLGPVAAFRRFAGLPVEMPSPVLDGLVTLAKEDPETVRQELTSTSGSPLIQLQRIAAARRLRGIAGLPRRRIGISMSDIRRSLFALLGTWSETAAAYLAVLRWTGRILERTQDWRALAVPLRLATVWVHADQITSILFRAGAPPDWVRRRFDELDERSVEVRLTFDRRYESSDAYPDLIAPEVLLFHGLGSALGEDVDDILTKALREEFRSSFTVVEDGRTMPSPFLFQDRRGADNTLGSIFRERPVLMMASIIDRDAADRFEWSSADEFAEQAIKSVETSPSTADGWLQLSILGIRWLESGALERVMAAIRSTNLSAAVHDDNRMGLVLCRIVAEAGAWSEDNSVRSAVSQELCRVATQLSARFDRPMHPDQVRRDDSGVSAALQLAEAAFMLARRENGLEGTTSLIKLFGGIAENWPATIPLLRKALDQMIRSLPFEWSGPIWDQFIRFRSCA